MNSFETHASHSVAVYETHRGAENAVKLLNTAGFNMINLSIVGQNYETQEQPIGFVNAGDRMLSWGKFGIFWGSIWGLLVGSAMMVVPGVGYLMFAGYIVATLEGAVIGGGVAALAAALASIGIPKDSILRYEGDIKAGSFLVLMHGTQEETNEAARVLAETSPSRLDTFAHAHSPAETTAV